jgi:riboflavin biosynthesis pyrimidine reductase
MRLIHPPAEGEPSELSLGELAELYAPPDPEGSWLRANFVSTLDGAATGADGLSGSINDDADQLVFGLLRALTDVVLVGSGTVAAEHYRAMSLSEEQREIRTKTGRSGVPVLAIVTRSLDIPETQLTHGEGPVLVLHPSDCDDARRAAVVEALGADNVIEAGEGWVDPARALDMLRARGLTQVLCEGGPTLMAMLIAGGLVDELCLTISPLMVGGVHPRILNGAPVTQSWRLGHLLEHDSVLIGRWVAERAEH